MLSLYRKLEAKLVLALLFFIHLIKRVVFFWRKPRGLNFFLDTFSEDSVFPVTPQERMLLPALSRCQACSLCSFSCSAIQGGKAPTGFEPKQILLVSARSSHESEIFLEEWLPCAECNACTVQCPTQVPIHEAVQLVMERRKRIAYRR